MKKRVLITGARGFIGQNLEMHFAERQDLEVYSFTREHSPSLLPDMLRHVDFVFHLAGVNRPDDPADFVTGNVDFTRKLREALAAVAVSTGRCIPVLYSSSIQAGCDTSYGQSKREAELSLFGLQAYGVPVYVFRLPNVFGKWCRPNYNSAVATFCHNIARGLPIHINDESACLSLVYIDDVVEAFARLMDGEPPLLDHEGYAMVIPQYDTTVGEIVRLIQSFKDGRDSLLSGRVGTGLLRALYATYVSYLPPESFSYAIPQHGDARGVFAEMLRTPDCGQLSFFTAHPGVTRGGHYHNTKTEKFLVLRGSARFRFRNLRTGERHELSSTGEKLEVVDTVPGWAHDITNVGDDEMVVMLWANEVFDPDRPDTFSAPL